MRSRCSWTPHAPAHVAAYSSSSRLESEMTPCVVELVSSPDGPNLITTARTALAFGLLRCPIGFSVHVKVLQLGSSWKCPCEMVPHHPSCSGQCSTYARVISLVKFSTKHHSSSMSVARYPNNPTRLRNQDFCSSFDWFVTVTLPRIIHNRACCTFRSSTVQVAHVDSLFQHVPDQQTT